MLAVLLYEQCSDFQKLDLHDGREIRKFFKKTSTA